MDKKKLFIGGLPWSINNESLRELFSSYGEISEAIVIVDNLTHRSKGFGFVTFVNESDAQKALEMDGKEIEERSLVVNVARPREDRNRSNNSFRRNQRRSY